MKKASKTAEASHDSCEDTNYIYEVNYGPSLSISYASCSSDERGVSFHDGWERQQDIQGEKNVFIVNTRTKKKTISVTV